ncbi:MAG TPA: hypothetical protein EYQ50_19865 [Verrucomicrobiales bacterium]|nr:hypothetical protein [Verrucomicrobiales bacterium]
MIRCRSFIFGIILFVWMPWTSESGVIIEETANWNYFKGLEEASSPDASAWREIDFDDTAWQKGKAPFYYDENSEFSGNTELTDMRDNYSSVFLRKTFQITHPANILDLTLEVKSDDGCIIWINGTEIGRINVRGLVPAYNGTSSRTSEDPSTASINIETAYTLLVSGKNVIAVHALNSSIGNSSDFLFSAVLSSPTDDVAPTLVELVPPANAVVRELNQVEVFFIENVEGVDATDLLIDGVPAVNLLTYSPRNYAFEFPARPAGSVQIEWASDHGIVDLSASPNPFKGDSWNYTVDTTAPEAKVIISEFQADNEKGIRDEDGERVDWIEIQNLGPVVVDLDGWYLTDDALNTTKWQFPSVLLNVNEYLVVHASGKNRSDLNVPLHTNFKLNREGEYLALINNRVEVVSEFAPVYPPQEPDFSYGRDRIDVSKTGYLVNPTPGTQNSISGPGFAPSPVFSVPAGVYRSNFSVSLTAESGVIRYTVNGTVPTEASPLYFQPISVIGSRVIQARVFEDALLPSPIIVNTYTLIGSGLQSFNTNLPLLIINTSRQIIRQDQRISATITAIEPLRGKTTFELQPDFQGIIQIEGRGQTSAGFAKKPYNLEINDAFGNDLEVPLLGMPPESDWVLNNPYSDKTFLNNFLAFELHEKMGNYAVRRRHVEVFVDTSGGRLDYPKDYAGVYLLLEKIKIDNNRVDLNRLSTSHSQEPEISGGYIIKKDKNSPGDRSFSTRGGSGFSGQSLKYHEPKPREITPVQQAWIQNYMNQFEQSLYSNNWLDASGADHYSHYIDVDSFVDYHWIVEFAKQIDGYRLSNYMSKDRNGKLKMAPIWDWKSLKVAVLSVIMG